MKAVQENTPHYLELFLNIQHSFSVVQSKQLVELKELWKKLIVYQLGVKHCKHTDYTFQTYAQINVMVFDLFLYFRVNINIKSSH